MSDINIKVRDICFKYDNKEILDNISFEIGRNENVGIIGANGAGKSTLLSVLLGLNKAEKGKVIVNNKIMEKKNVKQIQREIGFVFQNADEQLFMSTVFDDVAFVLKNQGVLEDEIEDRCELILERLNIQHLKNRPPYKLSGGEKKVVSIASILVANPSIIFMDEPTASLDPKSRRVLINLLKELPQTKIITSHDLDMIYETCDRVILVNKGRVVADGTQKDILKNKELLEENNLELPLAFQNLE